MAAISFINPKGGSGKTTLALVLAQEMSRRGGRVAVIDADPNAVIMKWKNDRAARGKNLPFHIEACTEESRIAKLAEELSEHHDFVFIDLEGTANRMSSRAMTRSHLYSNVRAQHGWLQSGEPSNPVGRSDRRRP